LVRFLADENVESYVVETLIRRVPSVDIVSVHDVGLAAKDDRSILEWAASNERIVGKAKCCSSGLRPWRLHNSDAGQLRLSEHRSSASTPSSGYREVEATITG
jgi:hypothetical protein